ncbi:lactate dehydrogenase [Levilactobacillus tujiorum]|uniref:Lactate dehydrogenase n=1 Tax=Levilactobacillus tujiorum TaxID=2912243 RepID=A0ABX1L848_9LACO|nr:lactate dehydrogenase [Levilactobacillus tujiorum]MCH5465419.1 lactate dehydrogenase [Levilactobacillus tujiorum]NLR12445.1 lactate dehydrogenase [Lactobacillus sp. HBUAS51387]NLR30458.1 lactate dehydrogenase [Levilactobacillus tujiorum]
MRPTLLIQGNFEQASRLLHQLLITDLPLDCVVMPNTMDDAPRYQPLVVASALCPRLTIRVGTATDYGKATWLVVLDRHVADTPITTMVAELRLLVKRIVENGFNGQLIFAGEQDELLTYFAWKFSGLSASQIWGLGTYPLTRLLTYRLAERLGVGATMIQATVVGSASAPIVAWSRTYIGPAPLLMYLANADADFDADDLGKMGTWLQREATEQQATLRYLAIIRLIQATLSQQPLIAPVTNIHEDTPAFAAASPVLVGEKGIQHLTNLVLSDEEQQAYAEQIAAIRTQLTTIESQQTEGK